MPHQPYGLQTYTKQIQISSHHCKHHGQRGLDITRPSRACDVALREVAVHCQGASVSSPWETVPYVIILYAQWSKQSAEFVFPAKPLRGYVQCSSGQTGGGSWQLRISVRCTRTVHDLIVIFARAFLIFRYLPVAGWTSRNDPKPINLVPGSRPGLPSRCHQ